MNRALAILAAITVASGFCLAQMPAPSDPQALTLVAKSIAAMTTGLPVSGATLNANAIWIAGSDYFTGTATLQATGTTASRVDLNLSGLNRTEIRTTSGGVPSGSWSNASATPQPIALHNCWTDAAWFLPPLSSLTLAATSTNFFFYYVGQEQHNGVSAEHIKVLEAFPLSDERNLLAVQRLSAMDFYLDSTSFLPLAVAFKVHPDQNMNADIPMEVRFANYQPVSGIQVPFHIQRLLNGSLALDLTITNAVMSSTLSSSSSQVRK